MSRRNMVIVGVVLVAAAAIPIGWALAQGGGDIEFDDAKIIFEINSTDGDGGIQVFLDGEGWREVNVTDPGGTKAFDVIARGNVENLGITELFFESAEPPFDEQPLEELLAKFPAGTYDFAGTTIDGDTMSGEAELTHDLPAGPVTSPEDGVVVPIDDVVVSWEEVTEPAGIEIVGYQVIVEQEDPLRVFSADMPASARSIRIPAEFLQPDTTYKYEVLAIEASGNQTITEVEFETEE